MNEEHTIIGVSAAVGIAIMFLVKKEHQEKTHVKFIILHPCDIRATRHVKLDYLQTHRFEQISFEKISPDKNNNWINLADNDFDSLLPLADKEVKLGSKQEAIFELFIFGQYQIGMNGFMIFDKNEFEEKIRFLELLKNIMIL